MIPCPTTHRNRRATLGLVFLIMLSWWAPVARAGAPLLELACLAQVAGVLEMPELYRLHPDGALTLNDHLISTFEEAELSRVTEDDGETFSRVRHRWLVPGERLERQVVWFDAKGKQTPGLHQILDFKQQQLIEDGADVCHHDQYRPAPAQADSDPFQPPTPRELVREIYRHYVGPGTRGIELHRPDQARRYFTPETAALIQADQAQAQGEVGRLDWDPFVQGQDWEMNRLPELRVEEITPERVVVTALAVNGQGAIRYECRHEKSGWRIEEIRWEGGAKSLREILREP
ncbi:MAG: DUF3828 domain-containing protein [Magnetococcales bacterium]|nr:DUF3828 domain-containing protein [Magnetococcales bacterium]